VCPIESMPPEQSAAPSPVAPTGAPSPGTFGIDPPGEPPYVMPHHHSDIDNWKFPERNYYVFICLSVLLGFFGLDHFYLRSFNTAMQKFFVNLISFGLWYFWDIIQIAYDSKRVRDEGLTGPFDWIRGIGRGVFIDPVKKVADDKNPGAKVIRTKKDIVIYALLTIFFGWMGIDKLYLGLPWQGLTKLLTTVNIFTFLFGLLWVFYDMFNVLFFQKSVVHGSISPPMPYNLLFTVGLSGEPLFMPEEVTKETLAKEAVEAKQKGWAGAVGVDISGGMLPTVKSPIDLQTFRFLYRELAVPLLQPTVGTGVQKVDQGVKLTEKAVAVGTEVAATGPKIAGAVTTQMAAATDPNKLMGQIQAAAADKVAERTGQAGGGSSSTGSGPIIAGTLTAVVLAGAVKVISELLSDKKR